MTLQCIYSNNGEIAYWDEIRKMVILPDNTEYSLVCGAPNTLSFVPSLTEFKNHTYLACDMYNNRLLLIKKDFIKPFGPVLNAPYSITHAKGLIYVATYPDGIIEPAVIAILDDTGNYYGQLYLDRHVAKKQQNLLYSKDPDVQRKDTEKPKPVKLAVKSISTDSNNIIISYTNGETKSFDAIHPENAMLSSIGFRYVLHSSRSVRTKKSMFEYTIDNLSTLDYINTSLQPSEEPAFQNNIGYSIENNDEKDIYVYGIRNNNLNFSNMPSLLESILYNCDTDLKKVLALWDFVRKYMLKGITWPNSNFKDDGKFSVIRFLNSMGSGACGSFNGLLALMAQSAGISSKTGSLSNGSHAALRLFLDMSDIYVDALYGGCSPFYGSIIRKDRKSIETYDKLSKDTYLLRRSSDESMYELASMIGYKDGWIDRWSDRYSDPYTMGYFLRPKERMEFSYSFNGTFVGTARPHANIVTGRKILNLERNNHIKRFFELNKMQLEKNIFSCETLAKAWYFSQCPYPITGIQIEGRLYKGSLSITSDYSEEKAEYASRQEFCAYFGNFNSKALNSIQNNIYLEFKAFKAEFRIYTITLFFQANRVALCSLNSGINNLCIEADKGKLKVNHDYIHSTMKKPKPPILKKKNLNKFEWSSDDAQSYEFILSDEPVCEIPYLPIFHRIISNPFIEIDCNAILEPNVQYFWKIRSKNRHGVWGPWSHISDFKHTAPKKPEELVLTIKERDVLISWTKDKQALYYKVYGSSEAAFTPSDKEYSTNIKRKDTEATKILYPMNHIKDVKTSYINLSDEDIKNSLKYHYRIIAVDKKGNSSICSDYISLPHPWIHKDSICTYAYSGCMYSSYIEYVYSTGMMRYNRTPENPMFTDFTLADKLFFSIEGPSWLKVRDYDGYLSGIPNKSDIGLNKFIITLKNQNNEADTLDFEIDVQEGL
ncbi:MAG TPA: transglutaminase-like domain-containing protein [Clostridia bacterium]|jgi:hypothetical protein|nr:MAG: hypothetical protein BWX97_01725 [Firmicutes bacterium ADurb.Bin146]HOD92898.1 transglutaminase-like domain-containing protein [Clostridia bacterium]HQM39148.1 transglutaminase-like domain-containing protein [Clostridia bacterium]